MEHSSPSFIDVVVSWTPMLLLIAVWIFFMMRLGLGKRGRYLENHIAEMQKQNALLERIAKALEGRQSS